ncbi:MAG TPA: CPXCG motif-containing cysteine-rich protein [Candidatus Kapabacteria bacterium]|nr:CPXCG motif-containing cysteine-rich protein [Candidatus Kapabacteria bacterium]
MHLQTTVSFECAFCGVSNEIEFDPTVSRHISLQEDCYVCCRPNLIRITIDEETMEPTASAEMDT